MDEELKQYLDGMEGRIVDRVTESVTDRVTDRVTERVGGRIDAVEERLKDYVRQSNHDLETKIITEFHKWGRTSEMHSWDMGTRQANTDTGLLGERMLAVEDRVAALERERRG